MLALPPSAQEPPQKHEPHPPKNIIPSLQTQSPPPHGSKEEINSTAPNTQKVSQNHARVLKVAIFHG